MSFFGDFSLLIAFKKKCEDSLPYGAFDSEQKIGIRSPFKCPFFEQQEYNAAL